MEAYDGILCNNQVEIRRVAMHNAQPGSVFNLMELKVLKIDDSIVGGMSEA